MLPKFQFCYMKLTPWRMIAVSDFGLKVEIPSYVRMCKEKMVNNTKKLS